MMPSNTSNVQLARRSSRCRILRSRAVTTILFVLCLFQSACSDNQPPRLNAQSDAAAIVAALPTDNDHVFIRVPAGTYHVGAERHPRNPARTVEVASFEIATTETTNAQFARFIEATGYVTDAERLGYSMTFVEGLDDWQWNRTEGANWRHPFGPDDSINDKMNHPVTQISAADAQAYCDWLGVRLPTLVEWEIAARAGRDTRYPWGSDLTPDGRLMANYWQGETHHKDTRADGYLFTAPVGSFQPNDWGLYDVIGNVFEYCADPGTDERGAPDPRLTSGRGGSWWCSTNTCSYFNLIEVGQMDRHGSICNQGFRVAR